MRTLFTIIAAISALICFALIGITVVTLGTTKEVKLSEDALHAYQLKFDGLSMSYDARVKPEAFDAYGGKGFKTTTSETAGIKFDHQIVEEDPSRKIVATTGKQIEIPSLYPIALFGALPLLWVVSSLGGKKKKGASEPTGNAAA